MNETVTLSPSNVTLPESVKANAAAGVVFGEEARQNWKSFTAQSKISDRGMGLKFVAPTVVDGVSIAKLEKAEVDTMNEIWMNAVIVYVVGQNPTLTALKSFIMANWNLGNEPQMFKHEEGYFVVKMGSREASFNFHNEVLKVIPIWIKLPNLPLNCWSEDSLSRIGSLIGVPLYADECTSKALRVSFARILVEMDVTREVKKMVKIADPNGQTIVQPVLYDWLPAYCKKCNAWDIIVRLR
ncbi:uncharacterized protein LOC130591164 [Beta vulgaris subsp. vulgaris]|uniref:uncharacterized protein LOC130591164 n=1 Tax=Beta vulgaris subsp. vulgaris TaxID=3555 RepID=UPI002548FEE9|nr:uncharacterized protein LOC130591164 [Beta vulgaris subsp. vulgaris]